MQRSESAKLVTMLSAAYRDAPISDDTAAVYEAMLADLDFEVAKQAVQRLICSSKWLPTVAEIRAAAADVTLGPVRAGGEAWGDVVAAIRKVGSYRPPPTFEDPIVDECVKALTWRGLCLGENEAADRAKFVQMYDALAARRRVDVAAGRALPAPPQGFALPAVKTPQLLEPSQVRSVTAQELDAALSERPYFPEEPPAEPDVRQRQAGER